MSLFATGPNTNAQSSQTRNKATLANSVKEPSKSSTHAVFAKMISVLTHSQIIMMHSPHHKHQQHICKGTSYNRWKNKNMMTCSLIFSHRTTIHPSSASVLSPLLPPVSGSTMRRARCPLVSHPSTSTSQSVTASVSLHPIPCPLNAPVEVSCRSTTSCLAVFFATHAALFATTTLCANGHTSFRRPASRHDSSPARSTSMTRDASSASRTSKSLVAVTR